MHCSMKIWRINYSSVVIDDVFINASNSASRSAADKAGRDVGADFFVRRGFLGRASEGNGARRAASDELVVGSRETDTSRT